MQFLVNNYAELKLLVECIDIKRISASIEGAEWWGTAGTIIVDVKKNLPGVMPASGEPGAIISQSGGDNFIVTQCPKEFVWFAKTILFSKLPEPGPVACYESLPFFHLAYCMAHSGSGDYDIKEELLYICDQLIIRDKARERSNKPPRFFEGDK